MTRICHIVDDTTPGGVMRLLDFIRNSEGMSSFAEHEVVTARGGMSAPPDVDADIIVSHMVLAWRNLPFFVALRARNRGVSLVHVEHSYSPAFVASEVRSKTRFNAMLTVSLALFDRVVSISTAQLDWLSNAASLDDGKTVLIPPCVNLERFLALPPPEGPVRRIGAIGRLHPQKGFDLLIPGFRAVDDPTLQLDIYGDGPDRDMLVALAEGDPRIVFHGHVDDPVAAMQSVDVVAMPSRREPYGLVALEALAASRPVLVSRTDGLRDHIVNGAISVDQNTPDAWASAIAKLASGELEFGQLHARQTASDAERRFVSAWKSLVQDLLGRPSPV